MDALSLEDLERAVSMGCQVPGCKHEKHSTLYLTQRCHPKAGVDVRFTTGEGKIVAECHECKMLVFEFFVASSNQRN